MTVESRLLTASTSFGAAATAWGIVKGILNSDGSPASTFPAIIGMPSGSGDLGAFNIGIINSAQTIKSALQDLETSLDTRLIKTNNLSDITNPTTARTNLGLGSSATWNVGTSGATVPLLNTANTWSAKQTYGSTISATSEIDVVGTTSTAATVMYFSGSLTRWLAGKNNANESGGNAGSDFVITRYNDAGAVIDTPLKITRSTGALTLSQPLPVASGGTGTTSLSALKAAMNLDAVDNTSDTNTPLSSAAITALALKYDKVGGPISGPVAVSGSVTSSSFIRSKAYLAVDGGNTEGGQIVLGYKTVTNLSAETSGTWNIEVDAGNGLHVYAVKTTGSPSSSSLRFAEDGAFTLSGNGQMAKLVGSGSRYQGLTITNTYGSGSQIGTSYLEFRNENDIPVSSVSSDIATDGSATISLNVTPAGSRTADRTAVGLVIASTGMTFGSGTVLTSDNTLTVTNKTLTTPVLSTTASGTTAGRLGYSGGVLSFGDGTVQRSVVTTDGTQTLTNKSLTSPALTGTPTAPTAGGGTNTTQVATTAFVQSAVSGIPTSGSPLGLDKGGTGASFASLTALLQQWGFTAGSNANGYWRKMPDGNGGIVIEQWGNNYSGSDSWSANYDFPIPFTILSSVSIVATKTVLEAGSADGNDISAVAVSASQYKIGHDDYTGVRLCGWRAIGY